MAATSPLLLLLPVQALLLCWRLGLLPPWGDEYATLVRAELGTRELIRALASNVHPPLYFLLARGWLALPLPLEPLVQLRALSVLFALGATVAIDRLWLRRATPATRWWFHVAWTFSPCLLLYARMGRSYSLQLLLAVAALYAGWRLCEQPRARHGVAYASLGILLFYTHYLAAAAVVAGVSCALILQLFRRRDAAALGALVIPVSILAAAVLPWRAMLASSVGRVAAAEPFRLSGSTALDALLAAAFAFFDFSFGESLPAWGIAAGLLLLPALLALWWIGVANASGWTLAVLPAALVAAAGALHWVSLPFFPARLFFLLPFHLLLIITGRERRPVLGNVACGATLLLSVASIGGYFSGEFLNTAYVIPSDRIAELITRSSPAGRVPVLLEHRRANLEMLRLYLPPRFEVKLMAGGAEGRALDDVLAAEHATVVWILRPTGGTPIEQTRERTIERTMYVPYSTVDRLLLERSGRAAPSHAIELLAVRRAG